MSNSNASVTGNSRKERCLNIACKSSNCLIEANFEVLSFYDIHKSKRNNKVCSSCSEKATKFFDALEDSFDKDEYLFNQAFPSKTLELFSIDSDEEVELSSDSEKEEEVLPKLVENSLPKVEAHIKKNLKYLEKDLRIYTISVNEELKWQDDVQQEIRKMREAYYKRFKPEILTLTSVDLDLKNALNTKPLFNPVLSASHGQVQPLGRKRPQINKPVSVNNISDDIQIEERILRRPANLPKPAPFGVSIHGPPININSFVYIMKTTTMGAWSKGVVLNISKCVDASGRSAAVYNVKFPHERKIRTVFGKHLAYTKPYEYLYRIGMRVIAMFGNSNYYSGIVAEFPKEANKWRYLIFYDDGYTAYTNHSDVLAICEPSKDPSEDVPAVLREFTKEYLSKYPERAMVKLTVGEKISTLYKNKWVNATCLEVDCSLVRMKYGEREDDCDWVFRGSDRLRPLYESKINAARRTMENIKNVHYKRLEDTNFVVPIAKPKLQTARKSLSGKSRLRVYFESGDKKLTWTPVSVPGKMVSKKVESIKVIEGKMFTPHTCNRSCVSWIDWNFNVMIKKVNLLAIPLYTGFKRFFYTFQENKKCIIYSTPCGRRLRSTSELRVYLNYTHGKWTIDMFEFDHFVDVLREYVIENANITIKDISNGREIVPISCVNYIDMDVPKTVDYMTERKPKEGVEINTNLEFMVCCDCTDDCSDKVKCSCWQLTFKAHQELFHKRDKIDQSDKAVNSLLGYQNRRLPEHVVSGIYECNARCNCSKSCHNRVVQFPMRQKLQLFKTEMKGWGLRCLNDIPQGSFICIYAGHLLTDNDANEEGKNYGDEYLAELDFIECMERTKEGYESDVPELEDSDSSNEDNTTSSTATSTTNTSSATQDENSVDKDLQEVLKSDDEDSDDIRSRLRKRKKKSEKEGERKTSSLMMTLKANRKRKKEKPIFKSLRDYFGEDESVYIMDARTSGNIGRYLNHSCSPNVFVQNVFVDTHDPRFPWVSFFALKYIKAGSELTWDYAYDIGSVPDKVVYCYCGSAECRHRLL